MSQNGFSTRGATWVCALAVGTPTPGYSGTLQIVDATLAGQPARYVAVASDVENRFPHIRNDEIGLIEGW